jgi:hypothetical protein
VLTVKYQLRTLMFDVSFDRLDHPSNDPDFYTVERVLWPTAASISYACRHWPTTHKSRSGWSFDRSACRRATLVHDVKEHVQGIGAVREIAHFVDHEYCGVHTRRAGEGRATPAAHSPDAAFSRARQPALIRYHAKADPTTPR